MTSANLPSVSSSRRVRLFTVAAVSLLAMTAPRHPVAMAADNFWTGGAGNGNFSDNANWSSPPSWGFGNSLVFQANTTAPTLTNDYGSWRDNNDIYWDTTFPVARTLQSTGDFGINLKLRVQNNGSFNQTVTMPLSGGKDGAGGIQLNPVAGSLTLSGPIYNDNSVDYAVFGSQTATVTNLTLNTALGPNAPTQTDVDFVVAGGRNTAVEVNANQVWAGTTNVQSGSFTTGSGVTLASSAIVVAGGTVTTASANTFADTASLTVNSGRLAIGGSDTVASLSGSGGTVDLATGATLTFGGSGSTSYAGSITGSGNLTKVGSGTFTLTGSSAATGTTTVAAGQFTLGVANRLADTSAVSVAGGGLDLGGNSDTVGSFAISSGSLSGGGTLTATSYALSGGTVTANLGAGSITAAGNAALNGATAATALALNSGTLTLGSASRFTATTALAVTGSTGASLVLGGSETIGALSGGAAVAFGSNTLTVGGANTSTTYSGGLSGPSGVLTKVGSGTLTLGGSNSYGGGTTVTAGRLVGTTAGLQGAITNNAAVTFEQISSGTYAGNMGGSGSLTKLGSGIVVLTGVNTYAGSTLVDDGTLRVNGLPSTSDVSVTAGATLAGTGTIGGPTTIFGTHSPGDSPGVQTFSNNLTYEAGSIISWELIANTTGSAGTDYDQIVIPTANLVFSGSSTLDLSFDTPGSSVDWANAFWNVNRSWSVLDLSAGTTTGFGNLVVGGSLLDSLGNTLSPTTRGSFSVAQSGQDVVLNFTAVPEPSVCVLAVISVGLAAAVRRQRTGPAKQPAT